MGKMNNSYLNRACPICNSVKVDKKVIQSKIQSENLTLEELRPYWNGFFKDKVFFTYYRCSSCSLLYAKSFFTKKHLDDLYSNMPNNTAGVSVDTLQKTQSGYYELIKKNIEDKKGSYLELGPDIGLLTRCVIKKKSFDKVHLLEPNKEVWDQLKEIDNSQEILISNSTDDFSEIKDSTLSLVVMVHGPDHFINPRDTLEKLKLKMKKKGIIVFVNHDESSMVAKITGSNWPAYCMQHPQLFNTKSIAKLFEVSGFEVLNSYKTKNYFPISYLVKHGFWALGFKVNFNFNNNLEIGLKLGNIMTIATLK